MLTAAYYLSFIIMGLASAAEGPSLPTLAKHTSSPLEQISLIFVFGALGYMLGSLIGGRAYDHIPGHRLIAFSMLVILSAAVIFPIASTLWLLLLAALTMGLGKGALDVGCNTLLQWVHGEKVGPFMNGLHFSFGVGAFLSPILLAQIISITHEIYWVFWTIALLSLPLAVWFWFLPEPPARLTTDDQNHSPIPFLPVLLILLAFVLYVGAEVGFSSWIYTYAVTLKSCNDHHSRVFDFRLLGLVHRWKTVWHLGCKPRRSTHDSFHGRGGLSLRLGPDHPRTRFRSAVMDRQFHLWSLDGIHFPDHSDVGW